jgi:hypothetical protein
MLRDDSSSGPGRRRTPRNVLGEPLEACSIKPMTGFYRDGCCNTGARGHWQPHGLRRDDFRVSRFFQIPRQRSFDTNAGIRISRPETR